jgi:hypothetical protein
MPVISLSLSLYSPLLALYFTNIDIDDGVFVGTAPRMLRVCFDAGATFAVFPLIQQVIDHASLVPRCPYLLRLLTRFLMCH